MYKFEDHSHDGINLFKISQFDNFTMEKQTLLGLLDGNVSSMKFMNEFIEPHVEKILKRIKSEDIYWFKYNWNKRINRVATPS